MNTKDPAEEDPVALGMLARKVAQAGRQGRTVSYKELFDQVLFEVPAGSTPRTINVRSQAPAKLIRSFLRRIVLDNLGHGFMASALVTKGHTQGPGRGFYRLAEELGFLEPALTASEQREFWNDQRDLAFKYYRTRKS